MPIYLRQSTASQEVPLGVFVDDADADTQMTALTIANTDIKIWKTGATVLASKNSGGATHISNGIYYATLDDTDTNTLGPLVIFIHVADALPVRLECVVLAANVYDSIIAASDKLEVDPTLWVGTTIPAPNTAGVPIVDLARILGSLITGTASQIVAAFTKWFNVAAPTGTVNSIPDAVAGAASGLAIVGSAMDLVNNAVDGGSVDATAVTEIQSGLATSAEIAALNNVSAAQVNAEVDAALADVGVTTTVTGRIDAAISTRASQASATAIQAKTDLLAFTGNDVKATLDGETVALTAGQIVVKRNQALSAFMFTMISTVTSEPVAGLTVSATRSIDGAAFAAAANAVTEIGSGWYSLDMDATDLNGSVIAWHMTAPNAFARDFTVLTQP